MEPYGRTPAQEQPRPDPDTGLEGSMWQMGLAAGSGGPPPPYPERPGEADCNYYLRTGSCGYGERCRYNHPRDRSAVAGVMRGGASEYPERMGQPACQYFLKTGTCKYGSTCKYDHPRQGDGSARLVTLNYLGYPLRSGEKECTYYLRTGQCKFGSTCKYHHPQPAGGSVPSPSQAFYPSVQASSVHSPSQYSTIDVTRPSVLTAPYIQGPYGPMLVPPGMVPVPGWTPYPVGIEFSTSVSPVVSPGGQHTMQTGTLYGSSNQLSPSAPAYQATYTTLSSAAGPSSSSQKERMFPDRPGQPECQYYMRTGDCKFGSTCKYHHPPERSIPPNSANPSALPAGDTSAVRAQAPPPAASVVMRHPFPSPAPLVRLDQAAEDRSDQSPPPPPIHRGLDCIPAYPSPSLACRSSQHLDPVTLRAYKRRVQA